MDDHSQPLDPAMITFLRRLVTVLTGTMIVGFLVIIVLFVIRFSGRGVEIPDGLTLPEGTKVEAFTKAQDWVAVTTTDGRLLIYAADTGAFLKEVELSVPGN